jgi:hypothetical protein
VTRSGTDTTRPALHPPANPCYQRSMPDYTKQYVRSSWRCRRRLLSVCLAVIHEDTRDFTRSIVCLKLELSNKLGGC